MLYNLVSVQSKDVKGLFSIVRQKEQVLGPWKRSFICTVRPKVHTDPSRKTEFFEKNGL